MVSKAMGQIILIGAICFGTIGMFNAMSSIGNAGKHSPTAQNLAVTSSSIAYIIGFLVSGGTYNMLGPRPCVVFGGLTFVLYAGAMRLAKDNDHSIYPPLAGILLGLGAGLIWVTQGAMMMSYPTEDNKGKYIAIFWAIFNLGAVLGSILPLVMNNGPGMDPDDVSPQTYYVYMIVMGVATLLAFFLSRPSHVVRDNGEPVTVAKFAGVKSEFLAILSVFCDWRMLLLIPAFFFSNFSYTYQFNDFNGFNFNIRTRSLNSILFWVAQIIGALVIGHMLDRIPLRRPRRAMLGLLVIGVLFMATWVGALMMQLKYKWERRIPANSNLIDYEHGESYTGPLTIYAMFGFCDAAFAVFCYWLMGALSNKHDELSRYAGFFKSIQSLGSAVAAPLDLAQTPLLAYLVTNWILCAFSILAMFLVCRTITDTTVDQAGDDSNNADQGEGEGEREEGADDASSYYYDDDDECSYEYDDDYEQDGTDESGSCCSRSITSSSHSHQEKPRTSRPPTLHSSSFEADSSTICGGTSSDGSKAVSRPKATSSSSRHLTRSSTRTTDSSTAQPHAQASGASEYIQDSQMETLSTQQKRRSSSLLSSGSVADPTRYPSPTFQHPHEQVRRSLARMSNVPPMTEIQDSSNAHAEMRAHLSRSILMQRPEPTLASEVPSQYSLYTPRGGAPASTATPVFTQITLGTGTSFGAQGLGGGGGRSREEAGAHGVMNSNDVGGPSMAGPTPTLMITQESSQPVPLDTIQPFAGGNNGFNDSSLGLGFATPNSFLSDASSVGLLASNNNTLQPYAPDYLYPHLYQPPYQLSQGAGSSTGSTRYDEDQDMDSVETCSISSMSSGRDSIASMSEMAPNPDLRPPRRLPPHP